MVRGDEALREARAGLEVSKYVSSNHDQVFFQTLFRGATQGIADCQTPAARHATSGLLLLLY